MMILRQFDRNMTSFLPDGVEGKRFLLAVSGGIDSMCMADLFYQSPLKLNFGIATVNFKLRPGDCDLDQELVRGWAAERGIPFHTIEFDTHKYAQEHSISTQMAARDLRYGWFYELLESQGYDCLAIAHNMDDSAETLFLNLLRGTGLRGLGGIRAQSGAIIRPLVSISREEIRGYVEANKVPYRDDKTNFESHYSRNRIRNVVFPEFREINPSFLETITRNTSYFLEAEEILDDLFASKKGTLYMERDGVVEVNVDLLMQEKHRKYWLYRIMSERGFNSAQVEDVLEAMCGQSGKSFKSPAYELLVDRGVLKIYPLENQADYDIVIDGPGQYEFRGVRFSIALYEKGDNFDHIAPQGHLYLDGESFQFPLVCRGWRSGDRFRPLGLKGEKKLSDFFKDLKMDKREKISQPVLVSGESIVALPGLRIDDRYKIKTSTTVVAEVIIL